jgi:cyclophilin family peptidyl-prolyl cis-trans isomerase
VNRTIITLTIVGALVLAACGTDADATTTTTTTVPATTVPATTTQVPIEVVPQTYEEFREQPTACSAEAPAPAVPMEFAEPEDMGLDPALKIPATIVTSCGSIEVELDPSTAPETVNSFVFLAEEGYFDGTVSHRILPGFVMQAGDQTATGIGGPGYTIADEFPPPDFVYTRGTLAMANAGPGTTGSQFFIVLEDVQLPPQFSVFGEVVAGLEVLDRIEEIPLGRAPTSADPSPSTPLETLYLDAVRIAG